MSKTKNPFLLIVAGPTASGKTEFSLKIAAIFSSEIINADVGQFYKPLSVGTAKPDWQNQKVKHNLFDIIDKPKDLSVAAYRQLALEKASQIHKENKLPILVGGSLFYLKSLYFPPSLRSFGATGPPSPPAHPACQPKPPGRRLEERSVSKDGATGPPSLPAHPACQPKPPGHRLEERSVSKDGQTLWQQLNEVDPKRAQDLHPNDIYRIQRALQIWQTTGIKPSEYKPEFSPSFDSIFVFIKPQKDLLADRINKRTEIMIQKEGWIDEAKKLYKTEWEIFLKRKGLIGYPEIFDWIENGEKENEIPDLIQTIQTKTRRYAKRQVTFWNSFRHQLEENIKKPNCRCDFFEVDNCDQKSLLVIQERLREIILV